MKPDSVTIVLMATTASIPHTATSSLGDAASLGAAAEPPIRLVCTFEDLDGKAPPSRVPFELHPSAVVLSPFVAECVSLQEGVKQPVTGEMVYSISLPVDIPQDHLERIQAYLEFRATSTPTDHAPFHDFMDSRIAPRFSTSVPLPIYRGTTDPSFTLKRVLGKWMDDNGYSPFERDLVVRSSDLDSATLFVQSVSFFGIEHLDRLAQLPHMVWSIFFPDNYRVLETYFGTYGITFDEVAPEEKERRSKEAFAILEAKHKPLVEGTWAMRDACEKPFDLVMS